ncbi:DUF5959 family protein [Streptomyces sp. NPDC088387]|uniref:DUF5959 family protein n=1 Tax=Streptomyces sp. NPDC088387 TaxID=3365859 RepID=UPI00382250F3
MAEEPMELIRIEGGGNAITLRITGRDVAQNSGGRDYLNAEFRVEGRFVGGTITSLIDGHDLDEWQQALDALDAGYDIAWCEKSPMPTLFIDLDEHNHGCRVSVREDQGPLTTVSMAMPLSDKWFDDAYRRLDKVRETWPLPDN